MHYEKANEFEDGHKQSNEEEVYDSVEGPIRIPGMAKHTMTIVRALEDLEHNTHRGGRLWRP